MWMEATKIEKKKVDQKRKLSKKWILFISLKKLKNIFFSSFWVFLRFRRRELFFFRIFQLFSFFSLVSFLHRMSSPSQNSWYNADITKCLRGQHLEGIGFTNILWKVWWQDILSLPGYWCRHFGGKKNRRKLRQN